MATSREGAEALVAASGDDRQVAILADDPGELDNGQTVFRVAARLFRTHDADSSWSGGRGETGTPPTWC